MLKLRKSGDGDFVLSIVLILSQFPPLFYFSVSSVFSGGLWVLLKSLTDI